MGKGHYVDEVPPAYSAWIPFYCDPWNQQRHHQRVYSPSVAKEKIVCCSVHNPVDLQEQTIFSFATLGE
jgi:hypothetical protein